MAAVRGRTGGGGSAVLGQGDALVGGRVRVEGAGGGHAVAAGGDVPEGDAPQAVDAELVVKGQRQHAAQARARCARRKRAARAQARGGVQHVGQHARRHLIKKGAR